MENSEAQPIAATVATNVRDLRRARGLSLDELSKRLDLVGRPIALNVLSKIERQRRAVDVDDLVALALALGVTPNRLLLPGHTHEEVDLAPEVRTGWRMAWRWATAEFPMRRDPATGEVRNVTNEWHDAFRHENRPDIAPDDFTLRDAARHKNVLKPVGDAARAAYDAGVHPWAIRHYMQLVDALDEYSDPWEYQLREDEPGQPTKKAQRATTKKTTKQTARKGK